MDVGRSAENAFYSFLELLSGTLGLRVTKDTKKSDVGGYFNSLGAKLGEASEELEKVAKKSEGEGAKDGPIAVAIRSAIDKAKTTLNTLKEHLESLKNIGDVNKVVEVVNNQNGVAADTEKLKIALKAFQGIVETAKTEGVEEPKKSGVTLASNSIGVDAKDGARVLTAGVNAGAATGGKSSLIVSSVRGEEMLASIVSSTEDNADTGVANQADGDTTAVAFAKGGNNAGNLAKDTDKSSAVAGGIALRSLVKDGKLASHNDNSEKAVQGAGVTAANKLLVAVEDVIKKTVKKVLEKVKGEIDKARAPKPTVQ
ncbi:variable large family protein (plasmid) [Borrelia puertoricensis]|nr:variable large family protein [Borrelia puertoricensis]